MSLGLFGADHPTFSACTETSDVQDRVVKETPPRYFVKRIASQSRETGSVLSGDDEPHIASKPARLKPTSTTASRAASLKAGFGELVEVVSPTHTVADLILGNESAFTLSSVASEFRRGDEIRRHGLQVRSKLLFCGPPGCGKSLCAEVVAAELKMPLVIARLDAVIASHLGETATNLRKMFDAARTRPVVLFLDEFDALARARDDTTEHSEIRRVVNSLLMMIDTFQDRSLLIAATNLEQSVDRAIWRRFDEVVVFEKPTIVQIRQLLRLKTKNFPADFDITKYASEFLGMSFAQIERACLSSIKSSILDHKKSVSIIAFEAAVKHEKQRATIEKSLLT
ncbi:ATP-binding protein [Novosphingobium sp. G106]|uniref:AAA family ATPase n=1 Tax=Novosphingobium sp. G106 TaxID=2849500 RepID=UPI001C2D22DC|nr:ATP-binding protein [Novosphingobium sp. G106]MBV1690385.1 ATP-binding protein [Novosphingobium sp. G106]